MSSIDVFLIKHGFIYPSNEIYGRLQNLWDYGHLGSLVKDNIRDAWKLFFVTKQKNVQLFDGCIFSGEKVWESSGHLTNFNDILVDCKDCKKRFRQDHSPDGSCLHCKSKNLTEPHAFNLMFKSDKYYLRPETAQSIFINFKNILNSGGVKFPFSIAQIGKAFRNEVTIQNSIFRTREFEQMELEAFTFPDESEIKFDWLVKESERFLIEFLQIKKENVKLVNIAKEELAHYSKKNIDIFYQFDHGWTELCGIANRTDFDLRNHAEKSNTALHYVDNVSNQKIIPHVVEHSIGLNRLFLAVLTDAYVVQEDRAFLKIKPSLAAYKFAIFPLTKKHSEQAEKLYDLLLNEGVSTAFEEKNSIGKRYKRHDEIGTPYCITFDDESLDRDIENCTFTIRFRDTMEQKRINLKELALHDLKNRWF